MVDLKKIFSEEDLKNVQFGEGACAIIELESGGYMIICKKNVQDLMRELKKLKEINDELKLLKLKL